MNAYDDALDAARAYLLEGAPGRLPALISQAVWDLHNGPSPVETEEDDPNPETRWPGFSAACDELRELLDDLPGSVYVDADSGCVTESRPECWACPECDGDGCNDCNHVGSFELETYYELTSARALGGAELAAYIS